MLVRSIKRNQLTEENYSKNDITSLSKILSHLIKLSTTKDKKYIKEIKVFILTIKDPFYLTMHERIAEVFEKTNS